MIVRLLVYIIAGVALLLGSGALTLMGWLLLKPENKGKLNAKRQAVLERQVCRFCDEPTSEGVDVYEDHIGWYHKFCMRRMLA